MDEVQLEFCELLGRLNALLLQHTMGRVRAVVLDEKASYVFGLVPYQSAYVHTCSGEVRVACGPLVRVK